MEYIKGEEDGVAAGAEWVGDDIYGLIESFFLVFNKDKRLIPIIAASMNKYIETHSKKTEISIEELWLKY